MLGKKLKEYDDAMFRKVIALIDEGKIGLHAIAVKLRTHRTVLFRNMRRYYGAEEWEDIVERYRNKGRFNFASSSGKDTQFKKGQLRYCNARRWRPIGAIRVKKRYYGPFKKMFRLYKLIKVTDNPYGNNWITYSRWLWEKKHGPIPPGKIIIHLDLDTMNDDDDNMMCMTRGEFFRYRDARFPGLFQQRKRRMSVSARRRWSQTDIRPKVTFYECNGCGWENDAMRERCPKCGCYSIERKTKEVA